MGSYCTLYVAGVDLGSTKNDIDPSVMLLFRASDRIEKILRPGTPQYLAYYAMPEPGADWEAGEHTQVIYRTTCGVVQDRLDLLGFSAATTRRAFSLAVARELAMLREHAAGEHSEFWQEAIAVHEALTLETWLTGLKQIIDDDFFRLDRQSDSFQTLPPLIRHMLAGDTESWLGCPVRDVRHVIRLVLELVPADEPVEYDLTDLVGGGWLDSEADIVRYAEELLRSDAATAQRVIVLTEGSTDKSVLEASLSLLAPHLADYFTFMDFDGAKVPGGSGALAQTVKAFVGAGILNRIVAVFDNDTAAAEALTVLAGIDLPSNYAVMQYPPLEFLVSYPTLGPTGVAPADVNGVAASIELYLGSDVLRGDDGELVPVHWRGFNDRMGRYQGVVREKAAVLERFRAKVARCRAHREALNDSDWIAMRSVIASLAKAAGVTAQGEATALEELE